MENSEKENTNFETDSYNSWESNHRRGKLFGGLIIVGIGCLFLAREMGAIIPSWIFSWQMLLIVIGLYVGVKHAFQRIGWLIMIMIGSAFLLRDYMPQYDFTHYLWPLALIILGLFVMLRPKRKCRDHWRRWDRRHNWRYGSETQGPAETDSYIDVSSVFGNVKKNIISKAFKGGEVNCVFGGAEINFSQADIEGTARMEVNAVFGGARLIVPSNWNVKSELTAVLGNVEDKRPVHKDIISDESKVLILEGNAVFGGIEIRSY